MMKDLASYDEALELITLTSRMRYAMRRCREKECAEFGITAQQAAVIIIIRDLGGEAKPSEISLWLFRKRHSVHSIIERMEKAGLVKKVRDYSRKNGVKVTLTKKSQGLMEKITKQDSLQRTMSSLPQKKRTQLRSYLKILHHAALEELGIHDDLPLRPTSQTRD